MNDNRKLQLRRESLVELTEADLRAAVGAEVWSDNAMTCLQDSCERLRSMFNTLCICQTD